MPRINFIRYIVVVLILAMIGVLSACSENTDSGSSAQTPQSLQADVSQEEASGITAAEPNTTNDTPTNEIDASSETSNVLIAYFAVAENSEVDAVSSASVRVVGGEAKGHIRVLADGIQNNVGGEMFSILTSTEYQADIRELIDYADKEQKENARPELTSHIEKLDDYDVVFIGYPNWWYDLPMVMYSFFEEYDFSGKTIVPFCTHNGSGFSDTINTIRELEPNATVLDGFTTNGDNVEDVSDDVAKWISELDI